MDRLSVLVRLVALLLLSGLSYADYGGPKDGATTATSFGRRAGHAGMLDVKSWTNDSVVLRSTAKVQGVPNLIDAGLWPDEDEGVLYTGFAGDVPHFSNDMGPYMMGIWAYTPDSGHWKSALSPDDDSNVNRSYIAQITYSYGAGYVLGGAITKTTSQETESLGESIISVPGLVKFDMSTKKLTNTTVNQPRFKGYIEEGQMLHVPVFGPEGVLVVMGGGKSQFEDQSDYWDFETVSVYDPAANYWYDQKTTGNIPQARKGFCVAGVASDRETYEIFMYGGYPGQTGDDAIAYDQIFILTLPAFHWIKVDYKAAHPRHSHTCTAVGGSQILSFGGFDSSTTITNASNYESMFKGEDPFTQGLAIFNMTSLWWADKYEANQTVYRQPDLARWHYDQNPGNATFNSTELQAVFDETYFGATATGSSRSTRSSRSSSSSSATSPARSESSTARAPTGLGTSAVAGIIVSSIAGALGAGAALFLYLRSRRRRRAGLGAVGSQQQHERGGGLGQLFEADAATTWAEVHGQARPHELAGGQRHAAHEKDGTHIVAELAASDGRGSRHDR